MVARVGTERLVEMLLAGSPEQVLELVRTVSPEDAAELRELRELAASLAISLDPVAPSPALRARILSHRARPRRPQRPAVVVLDMIQDYLAPGGPLEVPRARAIVPALKQRLAHARQRGIPVVYVCDSHATDDPEFVDWPVHAVEGTAGAEPWPELAPEPGDHRIRKRTYSAFVESDLQALLDRLAIDEIVLTGCATEIGLAATATDALQRGFVVSIPPDCQAGASSVGEQLTMLHLRAMPPFQPRYLRPGAP